ncbi:MAG: hypothetical protein FJ290_32200 [Planctomycetes bacterium]|nr:hypothetical protein [Planctomycetota bacterium]
MPRQRAGVKAMAQHRAWHLVLTTPGGRQFVLAEIDDFGEEVRLVRENQELMAFLRARSSGPKTLSEAEPRRRLGLRPTTPARNRRRQPSPTR